MLERVRQPNRDWPACPLHEHLGQILDRDEALMQPAQHQRHLVHGKQCEPVRLSVT